MKKFFKFHEISSEECPDYSNIFEKHKLRYNSPFKPRGPTPPKSREASPKTSSQARSLHFRHSSVDSNDVFVLKVPFTSVNTVNLAGVPSNKKRLRGRKSTNSRRHRRSGSLDNFY